MRPFRLLGVLCLFTVGTVGCADADVAPARMLQVADAWKGAEAARLWREGFFPLEDVVQLPEGAFHSEADKLAYLTQNFTLRGSLPGTVQQERIRWADGKSLPVTAMTAQQAYGLLDTGGEGRRNPLTVTKATLGEMTLRTSRGPARVPAWLLTLDGYDTPLKRVAVNPSKLPHAPIEPLTQVTDALMPLEGLQAVAQDDRAITVRAGHGACDDGAAVDVLETSDSVVLASSIRGTNDGACTSQLLTDAVTVRLGRPLGKRVLLDAFTGGPVQYSRQP